MVSLTRLTATSTGLPAHSVDISVSLASANAHVSPCYPRNSDPNETGNLHTDIFSAVPPNVTVVLNGSELERVINRIGQGKPNMPFLRRLVTAQDRRFPDRPESVRFFTALRILTETGYINYEKLAVKGIQSIMRKNWAQLAPVRFDDNDTRDAALLDAAESLSWLPGGSLSHHIWDDIPSIWMAFPHQIELPCVVHGTEQVQWYHNDQEISNVIHPRRIFTNRSLWIGSIRPSDEGVYRCEAMTPRGLITATSIVSVKVRKGIIAMCCVICIQTKGSVHFL